MAGCDFLPNIPKVGIRKALDSIKRYRGFVKVSPALPRRGSARTCVLLFAHYLCTCPGICCLVKRPPLLSVVVGKFRDLRQLSMLGMPGPTVRRQGGRP
jgi:hypothetical protein